MSDRKILLLIVSCCIFVGIGYSAFAQQRGQPPNAAAAPAPAANAAPRGANAGPMEDRRPPIFIKETFPMEKKDEIYISQKNISDPNVELKLYGQTIPQWQGMTH